MNQTVRGWTLSVILGAGAVATFAVAPTIVQAQQSGLITGRVTNASGDFPIGDAEVLVPALGLRTRTDRDGRFRLTGVPVGRHAVEARYLGAETLVVEVDVTAQQAGDVAFRLASQAGVSAGTTLETVLVVGQVAGQRAALNRERNAINNIEVLSSDAIGNFPDENVAEALQRVPGLSIQRDQGEGRFVTIRGLNADFNTTTVNGLRIPAPGADSRAVNLDIVSSDLVESVEISKSVTPDMDADSVGGNIEISTLTALDLGNTWSATLEGSYNDLLGKTSPRGTLSGTRLMSVGDGFENFGISASLDYFERDYAVYNVESGEWPLTEAPDGRMIRSTETAEQRDYELSRERLGLTVNFDFRPDAASQYFLRTLYSRFADNEIELEHEYLFEEGDITELTETGGLFENAAIEKRGKETTATRTITAIQFGGENALDTWTLDYRVGYAQADTKEPFSLGTAFIFEGLNIGYDLNNGREAPVLFAQNLALAEDPENYALDLVELESDRTEEDEITLQFNAGRDVTWGTIPARLKFGLQARLREKSDDQNNSNFEDFDQDYTLSEVVGAAPRTDYSLGRFGPAVDTERLRQFFAANRDNFGINEQDFIVDSFAEDFRFEEDIYAGYLMTEMSLGRLELLAGLRVEQTNSRQQGFRTVVDENINDGRPTVEPFAGKNDYTDVFPNLQGVYRLSDRLHLRGALTRTMSRPRYFDAAARQLLEIEGEGDEIERTAEIGNPDLKPLYANNLDVELTAYPSRLSAASVGLFYKDIEDFFVETDVAGRIEGFDGFDSVSQVINGDSARVLGIELSYVQEFGFLPSPWDGFLLSANYTHVDTKADVPFRSGSIPLPQQADNIANLAIGYEKYGYSLRLAANYRSDVFDGINDPEDASQDEFFDSELRFDFRGQYSLNSNVTLLVNLLNLTDENFFAYYGDSRFSRQFDLFGRTVEAGVKVAFR